MRRFTARRALTVGAWAGATVTWTMALLGEPAGTGTPTTVVVPPVEPALAAPTTTAPALPTPTEEGLLILRFTPVPPPPPQVVVRTVAAPQVAAPAVVVTSQGS